MYMIKTPVMLINTHACHLRSPKLLIMAPSTSFVSCLAIILFVFLLMHKIPLFVSRNPLPPRTKPLFTRIEPRKGVSFCVQHDFIEG